METARDEAQRAVRMFAIELAHKLRNTSKRMTEHIKSMDVHSLQHQHGMIFATVLIDIATMVDEAAP